MINYTFDKDYIIDVTHDYSPMRKNVYSETCIEELEGRELQEEINRKTKLLQSTKQISGRGRYVLSKKERFVEKTRNYKKLFSKGQNISIKKGINILVGDNGCGKSQLIHILKKTGLFSDKTIHVDMEKANPTISRPDPENGPLHGYTIDEINTQFMWAAESHGETREGVLLSVISLDFDMLILDEPEQGLSLKNQKKYINALKALGKDVIIITHSKVFIEEVEEVFDVEKMEWINSKEYLKNI
jgi:energy-coupling factor transporter ATP-binding protein EcfA2